MRRNSIKIRVKLSTVRGQVYLHEIFLEFIIPMIWMHKWKWSVEIDLYAPWLISHFPRSFVCTRVRTVKLFSLAWRVMIVSLWHCYFSLLILSVVLLCTYQKCKFLGLWWIIAAIIVNNLIFFPFLLSFW